MDHLAYRPLVEKHRAEILETERYLWTHPESGYKEWNTTKYLAEIFERVGYKLHFAGNIPGFYTDLDTGRPGPKLLIFGELDALVTDTHPERVNGCAHACGHNAQCAALVGAALAMKEPGALDGLCGSIRFMAVPAEEMIEVPFRDTLMAQGIIHYYGGKLEYMSRGFMDGCDIAFMNHLGFGEDHPCFGFQDANGFIDKTFTFTGKAAHAGSNPQDGVNALYAATLAMQAINDLRETFRDEDHVRVHPIVQQGGTTVNIIPGKAVVSTYVRGGSLASITETNRKTNRAAAAGALAMGAEVDVTERPGYAPLLNDRGLTAVAKEVMGELVGAENVVDLPFDCSSTDMGDLSCIIRSLQTHTAGGTGHAHGDDARIADPETGCVLSAVSYVMLAAALLENDAAKAKQVLSGPAPLFPDAKTYLASVDAQNSHRRLVSYTENGAEIHF